MTNTFLSHLDLEEVEKKYKDDPRAFIPKFVSGVFEYNGIHCCLLDGAFFTYWYKLFIKTGKDAGRVIYVELPEFHEHAVLDKSEDYCIRNTKEPNKMTVKLMRK